MSFWQSRASTPLLPLCPSVLMPNPMSEKERMLAGRLYLAFDEELGRDNKKARVLTRLFNTST
ncbi:maltose acetyltransferase domain-containing protein, partial [Salmonella sp. SAL4450]|uniref:maltose acetyltransferase domain-containing protein n=1 Tax=Salmonella sp. SAL4450 TaxID=3159905 RepID=UPI00397BB195